MADLSIAARYKYFPANIALGFCVLTSPFWAVVCPIIAVWLCFSTIVDHNFTNYASQTTFSALGYAAIFLSCAALTLFFADNRIIASETGLRLPLFTCFARMFRNHIAWHDITSMQIQGNPDRGLKKLKLRIITTADGILNLDLNCIEAADLEKILQCAEVWLPPAAQGPLIESAREKLANLPLLSSTHSQKHLYEDELDYRFASTAFIPLEPGDELQKGSLKIVRQLSFGGLSAVYLCQEYGRQLYVLKESVVPADTRAEIKEKAIELFKREAVILAALDHPRIVKVLRNFQEQNREYLLIEYLPGLSLRQLIRQRGPLLESDVAVIALSLAETIAYLHAFKPPVMHRDITPENIILTEEQTPILIDFGVANEFLGTATGTLVGKHCYISPEQFRGKATTRSDLYALGGTLHFLLTGEDPLPLSPSHPARINDLVSPTMDKLVSDLTEQEQALRINTTEELIERLRELMVVAT
jgi:tRNA A-37 threonylcarbamoyl transferase component Bud32